MRLKSALHERYGEDRIIGQARAIRRAIELNPSYADAHRLHGEVLWQTGRMDEAIAEIKRTLELDPLSINDNATLGVAFFLARQYDRATEQEAKTLELDPSYTQAHLNLGMAYVQKSMFKEAIAEFEKALVISPNRTGALSRLGYAYAVAGRRAEALKVLDQLTERSKQKYVPATDVARMFAGLKEKDKAVEWLEKAYEERSVANIKLNPVYDLLRSDSRFQQILRRMNLQP